MKIAELQLSSVFAKVQQLSSYEARGAVTATGESDYASVHITEQDKPWVNTMAEEGANQLITQLMPLVDKSKIESNKIEISSSTADSVRTNIGMVSSICNEAIYAYIMRQWCSEHKPSRSEFYDRLFNDSCHSALIALRSKRKPSLNDF